MEKFGIFELLDALSALTAPPPEEQDETAALDSAYLPPDYALSDAQGRDGTSVEKAPPSGSAEAPKSPHPESDALAGFYARHNAVAKKAGKK